MFGSVGLFTFLKYVLYLNAALAFALAANFFGLLPSVPLVSQVSVPVIVVSVLLFFLGQTTAFPRICSLPCVWRLFPNIDGEYEVEISSNWSIIKARDDGQEPESSLENKPLLLKRVGKARISARLTQIDMTLAMDDEYLSSETITCSVRRHQGERKPILLYMYDSHVPKPKITDSQRHLGAAHLSIPLERCPEVLEGNYWTDRNWHVGLNTAGHIKLTRIKAVPARHEPA